MKSICAQLRDPGLQIAANMLKIRKKLFTAQMLWQESEVARLDSANFYFHIYSMLEIISNMLSHKFIPTALVARVSVGRSKLSQCDKKCQLRGEMEAEVGD